MLILYVYIFVLIAILLGDRVVSYGISSYITSNSERYYSSISRGKPTYNRSSRI